MLWWLFLLYIICRLSLSLTQGRSHRQTVTKPIFLFLQMEFLPLLFYKKFLRSLHFQMFPCIVWSSFFLQHSSWAFRASCRSTSHLWPPYRMLLWHHWGATKMQWGCNLEQVIQASIILKSKLVPSLAGFSLWFQQDVYSWFGLEPKNEQLIWHSQ